MNIFSIRSNPFGLSSMEKLAAVLVVALLFWVIGLPTFLPSANAVNLAELSDTMTDTAPSAGSNHTITGTTTSGLMGAASEDIDVRFDAGFDVSSIAFGDVDILIDGVQQTIEDGAAGAGNWGFGQSGQVITLTPASDVTVASSSSFEIRIGTNATEGTTGSNQVTNPSSANSYQVWVEGNMQDSGNTWVVILDSVTVTAAVDTSFSFSVSGVTTGTNIFSGSATSTTITSTATALAFGTLTAGSRELMAHDLTVSTNAQNGFSVTIVQDQPLTSAVGATIAEFIDGAETATPTFWQAPAGTLDSPETYGHFGITSTDWEVGGGEWGDGANSDDGAPKFVGNINDPRVVFGHTGPSDGTTQSKGAARVGFALEIHELQAAGDDYTNTLTYVATPTF